MLRFLKKKTDVKHFDLLNFQNRTIDNTNKALSMLKDWDVSYGLRINPFMTELVWYTRKCFPPNLILLTLDKEPKNM